MIFGYFDKPDHRVIAAFLADWTGHFPQFQVFGDADVLPILDQLAPAHVDLYRALRIPAAKSDLARLALLHRHGGLYVDCHCGVLDAAGIQAMLSDLTQNDLVLIERPRDATAAFPRRLLINGVMAARPGLGFLLDYLTQAFENLEYYLAQAKDPLPEYDIWSMLGAYVLTTLVLEPAADLNDFRRPLRGRVKVISVPDMPIKLSAHRRMYNGTDRTQHWSARQGTEPLFDMDRLVGRCAAT